MVDLLMLVFRCFLFMLFVAGGLISTGLHASPQLAPVNDYLIDTDIGGDIDDVIALIVALDNVNKPLAITTTHIEPMAKAKISKLLISQQAHADIPVYAGVGVTRQGQKSQFLSHYPLWPPYFGYPNPSPGEASWFPKQGQAYQEEYGHEFDNLSVEEELAPNVIVELARHYSPENPLTVIALGPLHNIDAALKIDDSIKDKLVVFSMGGDYPKGYNWLISPQISAFVLSKVKVVTIPSSLIQDSLLSISQEEFHYIEKHITSRLGKTILYDWKNWYRADKGPMHATQLGDPITVFVALHPEVIQSMSIKQVEFPCLDESGKLKLEFNGLWYNKAGLDNKIIRIINESPGHIIFVESLKSPQQIKQSIISMFIQALNRP